MAIIFDLIFHIIFFAILTGGWVFWGMVAAIRLEGMMLHTKHIYPILSERYGFIMMILGPLSFIIVLLYALYKFIILHFGEIK